MSDQLLLPAGTAIVVRPGDKLIITFSQRLTRLEVDSIRERVVERIPGIDVCIVDGVQELAVVQSENRP